MREQTATFIGHGECYGIDRQQVSSAIKQLIEQGVRDFLCGGMGDFDWICASEVSKLKKRYTEIRLFLVIPYLSFSIRDREIFDDVIYPEGFEKYHFKAAIPQRNRYMVRQSATALCYINHGWGGASQTYAYAKRQGLQIKNLGSMT